jgi:hypothetical protein
MWWCAAVVATSANPAGRPEDEDIVRHPPDPTLHLAAAQASSGRWRGGLPRQPDTFGRWEAVSPRATDRVRREGAHGYAVAVQSRPASMTARAVRRVFARSAPAVAGSVLGPVFR